MNCTIYKKTFLNTVNMPDSPDRVAEWGTPIKSTVIDSLQSRVLKSITVRGTKEEMQDASYVEVEGFYYAVSSVNMTSADVAVLSLVPDYLTSAGGPGNLVFLDGITERHHIPKASDTFGAYNEADELLVPAQPLQLFTTGMLFQAGGLETDEIGVVEATVDLVATGMLDGDNTAYTFKDVNGNAVTIPSVEALTSEHRTEFSMFPSIAHNTWTKGTCLFLTDNENVKKGIKVCRLVGMESAIIGQYTLPTRLFDIVSNNGYVTLVSPRLISVNLSDYASGFEFAYSNGGYTPRNLRLCYGSLSKYGLVSCSGSSIECNPEELTDGENTNPWVTVRSDGRENGKPYFAFTRFRQADTTTSLAAFLQGCIPGMEWRNLPLVFTGKSGNALDTYAFTTQRNISAIQHYTSQAGRALDIIPGVAGSVSPHITQGMNRWAMGDRVFTIENTVANAMGSMAGAVGGAAGSILGAVSDEIIYDKAREKELREFNFQQTYIVPEVKFPFQSPSIRDYASNGVMAYRYKLSGNDLRRLDKLLTMYGYRITEKLEPDMFTNRPQFNYVKAYGVTIGGDLPEWWKAGIADQLSRGVRVWHVRPRPSYYNSNE